MSMQRKYLYRVLRNDEDHRKGLTAKDPDGRKIVADHVQYGRRFVSQFISTTTSFETAIKFASKSRHWPKVVVRINVAELQRYDHIEIIDLTCEHVLNKHINSDRTTSRFYAKKNKEVLIKGFIPPSCVTFERLIRQSFRLSDRPLRRRRHSYRPSSDTLEEAQASNMIRYSNINQPDTWYSHYENHSNVQFQTQHWQDEYFPETNYYDRYSRYAHVTHYEQYSNLCFQTPNWQNGYFSNADYDGYSRRSDVMQYEQYLNLRFPTPDWHDEYFPNADYEGYCRS